MAAASASRFLDDVAVATDAASDTSLKQPLQLLRSSESATSAADAVRISSFDRHNDYPSTASFAPSSKASAPASDSLPPHRLGDHSAVAAATTVSVGRMDHHSARPASPFLAARILRSNLPDRRPSPALFSGSAAGAYAPAADADAADPPASASSAFGAAAISRHVTTTAGAGDHLHARDQSQPGALYGRRGSPFARRDSGASDASAAASVASDYYLAARDRVTSTTASDFYHTRDRHAAARPASAAAVAIRSHAAAADSRWWAASRDAHRSRATGADDDSFGTINADDDDDAVSVTSRASAATAPRPIFARASPAPPPSFFHPAVADRRGRRDPSTAADSDYYASASSFSSRPFYDRAAHYDSDYQPDHRPRPSSAYFERPAAGISSALRRPQSPATAAVAPVRDREAAAVAALSTAARRSPPAPRHGRWSAAAGGSGGGEYLLDGYAARAARWDGTGRAAPSPPPAAPHSPGPHLRRPLPGTRPATPTAAATALLPSLSSRSLASSSVRSASGDTVENNGAAFAAATAAAADGHHHHHPSLPSALTQSAKLARALNGARAAAYTASAATAATATTTAAAGGSNGALREGTPDRQIADAAGDADADGQTPRQAPAPLASAAGDPAAAVRAAAAGTAATAAVADTTADGADRRHNYATPAATAAVPATAAAPPSNGTGIHAVITATDGAGAVVATGLRRTASFEDDVERVVRSVVHAAQIARDLLGALTPTGTADGGGGSDALSPSRLRNARNLAELQVAALNGAVRLTERLRAPPAVPAGVLGLNGVVRRDGRA
ncbi:hypothetical protein HK405_010002, partial [Cladochytrium tenue]